MTDSGGKMGWLNSVVTRLVVTLVVGGGVLSVGLGALELRRTESLLQMEVTQHVTLTIRNLQSVLRDLLAQQSSTETQEALRLFAEDRRITAVRVRMPDRPSVEIGNWPQGLPDGTLTWQLSESGISAGQEIDLDHPTLVLAPFAHGNGNAVLELLVDGPAVRADLRQHLIDQLSIQWLFLAVLCLLGLLLVRRWFTAPLSELLTLIKANAGPEPFEVMGRSQSGEFGDMAAAIGDMLHRIQETGEALKRRERALADLYQFAPAAMISLDGEGKIIEANQRAARLFGRPQLEQLLNKDVMDLVVTEDRAMLRQTIRKLDLRDSARSELRVLRQDEQVYVAVECTGVRNDEQALQTVRLSLLDVSESRKLASDLEHQSRLLNLVIDHMSDAILLVDADGRIAASNQQLASLLHRRPDAILGERYDPESFWQELGVLDETLFQSRLKQIDSDTQRSAQERFETNNGNYLFQGIPVHDAGGLTMGKLWVVQETTPQEQSQRLLTQQTTQLQAFKKLGQALEPVNTIDGVLDQCGRRLYEIFGVEAVGVALRSSAAGKRTIQVLHRGKGPYNIELNRTLLDAVERQLMPQVLQYPEVAFWPDLPRNQPWSAAFKQSGLTCLAAGPIRGSGSSQGILWIAQRGGEHIERHHHYLIESLAQLIASRIEIAHLHERMLEMEMTDPVTGLPGEQQLLSAMTGLAKRPGYPWSLVLVNLDGFRSFCERTDHAVGDRILKEIGRAFVAQCRRANTVARLRGSTFAIVAPDLEPDLTLALADRLREHVKKMPIKGAGSETVQFTASVGVAASPVDGLVPDELYTVCSGRLDHARSLGGDRTMAAAPLDDAAHQRAG